jgi:hypothetical protein
MEEAQNVYLFSRQIETFLKSNIKGRGLMRMTFPIAALQDLILNNMFTGNLKSHLLHLPTYKCHIDSFVECFENSLEILAS